MYRFHFQLIKIETGFKIIVTEINLVFSNFSICRKPEEIVISLKNYP
jgi:hypothetical protein